MDQHKKYRVAHDQSFDASVGASVNQCTLCTHLDPLFYGGCLSRVLHYIVSITFHHPTMKILGSKSDFKSVYRWVTLHGSTAAQCTMMCEQFGLPSLRLTFGSSPCPNEWCLFSEICTDLANDIENSNPSSTEQKFKQLYRYQNSNEEKENFFQGSQNAYQKPKSYHCCLSFHAILISGCILINCHFWYTII